MLWMRAHHEAAPPGRGAGVRSAAISWLQLPCSAPCREMALKGPAFTCHILPANAHWKLCASLQAELVPVGGYKMLTVNAISAAAQMCYWSEDFGFPHLPAEFGFINLHLHFCRQ